MAQTTGIMNGTDMLMYIGGTKVAHLTTTSDSVTMDTRDALTKDSLGHKDKLEGAFDASFTFDAKYAENAFYGYNDLIALLLARTQVTVKHYTTNTGDTQLQVTAGYVTNLDRSFAVEDSATFSATFTSAVAPTFTTIT